MSNGQRPSGTGGTGFRPMTTPGPGQRPSGTSLGGPGWRPQATPGPGGKSGAAADKPLPSSPAARRAAAQALSQSPMLNRNLEPEFLELEAGIKRFTIDRQRYFAGDLHLPPEELKDRLSASFKRLRNGGVKSVADNFRLNSLEAQFNSQLDLYNRKMRERELGGKRPVAPAEPAPPDPREGVVYGARGHENAVEILYKGLYLQSGNRTPPIDLERFRDYVGKQAETIRAKTGCDNIQFRVEIEEGKLKLKAKPIR